MITCFGESLFRLSTPDEKGFFNSQLLEFYMGGSELNVAFNLQALGAQTSYVTSYDDSFMGRQMTENLQRQGIDTQWIQFESGLIGFYGLERGSAPRPKVNVLFRQKSHLGETQAQFDWESILKNSLVFHTSGITLGLGMSSKKQVELALKCAQENQKLTSYDLNYRSSLWSVKEFAQQHQDLIKDIDILFASALDFFHLYQIEVPQEITREYGKQLRKYLKFQHLFLSERTPINDNEEFYQIHYFGQKEFLSSAKIRVSFVDRVGAGDAMAAGALYGLLKKLPIQETILLAACCGALKHSVKGDQLSYSFSKVKSFFSDFSDETQTSLRKIQR